MDKPVRAIFTVRSNGGNDLANLAGKKIKEKSVFDLKILTHIQSERYEHYGTHK